MLLFPNTDLFKRIDGGEKLKFGVIVFPGSNCDHDTLHVLFYTKPGRDWRYRVHVERDLSGRWVVKSIRLS